MLSALSWGTADFSGGIASRRSPALTVVLWGQPIGGLIALALALGSGETALPPQDIAWAALAGLLGPSALVFFYRGLAVGRMSVVAPIAGVLGAAVPVAVGLVLEGLPSAAQVAGIALALVSVLLVTRGDEAAFRDTGRAGGAGLAIVAGLGFGAFFVVFGRVGTATVFAPLVVLRIVATITMTAAVVASRGTWRLSRPSWLPVIVAGVLDMGGNLFYLLAAQAGRLDVAAVLASLYPLVTIVLAAVLLRERILASQAVGIGIALAAIVLISAG